MQRRGWSRRVNGLLRTLPPLVQEHPRVTAQLPDTTEIAHFDLPRLLRGVVSASGFAFLHSSQRPVCC